jgi:Rps23 Pro-64 3,4-dihydroxylase Tpa1-like proline 4-hydroxylase
MQVEYLESPFPHVIIHEMYNEEELDKIWTELEMYRKVNNFLDAERSDTAHDPETNLALKSNLCIKLDTHYFDRNSSMILQINRKLWHPEITEQTMKHWGLKAHKRANSDNTLLSYYEQSHYYKPHFDSFNVTALTHFFKEPLSFSGGNLQFPEFNYCLTTENNRCIIFPSPIEHAVDEVNVEEDKIEQGYGRWTMSQFMRFVGS